MPVEDNRHVNKGDLLVRLEAADFDLAVDRARATLGTIPFAWWGAHYGPVQVLVGQGAGLLIFGSLALWSALRLTRELGRAPLASGMPRHAQ